jgi:hypothetical protein
MPYPSELWTTGWMRRSAEFWDALFDVHKIDQVLDISRVPMMAVEQREMSTSDKKRPHQLSAFSKHLVDYLWYPQLANEHELTQDLASYREHLLARPHLIESALSLLPGRRTLITGFYRPHECCARSVLAEILAARMQKTVVIHHLDPEREDDLVN